MRIAEAEAEFRKLLQQSGCTLEGLRLSTGYPLVLAFYRDRRADGGKHAGPDSDMLLYQWGTYHWDGARPTFQIDFTRQFIEPCEAGDDGIAQLSLRFHFMPNAATQALGAGNLWLTAGPGGLVGWSSKVEQSGAFRYAVELPPSRVELGFSRV